MKRRFVALVAAVALSLQSCAHSPATPEVTATQPLAMEEFMVPSDPGVHVYVRNKYPRGVSQFAPAKVVLYVHGATYPFETAFDLPLEGRGPGAPRSWGNTPPSTTTKVNKLVLYAPQWLRSTPSLVGGGGAAAIPAYRTVTKAAARDRWLTGVAADKRASLIPPGWYEAWEEVTFATDQKGSAPGSLRAPNGVVQDGAEFWSAQKPLYDPALIRVPTFLVHAEWDADLSPQLHGAAVLRRADQGPVQGLPRDRRGDPLGDDGKEPHAAVPGCAGLPRRPVEALGGLRWARSGEDAGRAGRGPEPPVSFARNPSNSG